MAGKSTISITFKLDGDSKGFKDLAKDAEGLKTIITSTMKEAQQLNSGAINFAAIATGIDQAQRSIQQLQSALKGLTDATAVQEIAEQKLATTMRNTMDATDEDIKSIKALTAAQQELGVIGEEIQLNGAQELSTYLTAKENLEKLIPVMNDMIAQQYGLEASGENAANIATMLGKVMDGQVGALSRYGYTFDEAQEKVLRFGEESERAAVLADVVSASVGGMNAALAQTDAGKAKQLSNAIGGVKEKLGSLVQGAMPFIAIASDATIALGGIVKLTAGIKAATVAVAAWNVKSKAAAATTLLLGFNSSKSAALTRVFSAAMTSGAYSATAMKIALRGLMIATGVGAAIAGVTMLIEYFVNASDDATESMEELNEATDAYKSASADAKVAIDGEIKKLGELIDANVDTSAAVTELNKTYGQIFGQYKTAAEWYDVLTKKSGIYIKQIGYEAQAKVLAAKIAEKQIAKEMADQKRRELYQSGQAFKKGLLGASRGMTKEMKAAANESIRLGKEEKELNKQLEITTGLMKGVAAEMASMEGINTVLTVTEMNWQQVSDAISETEKKLKETTDPAAISNLKKYNAELKERKAILDSTLGFEKTEKPKKEPKTKTDPVLPEKIETVKDYADAITYWRNIQQTASQEEYAAIQKTIVALEAERDAFMGIEKAEKKEKETYTLVSLDKANTIKDLSDAIDYYRDLQATQSADEVQNTEKTIQAYENKKKALERGMRIPSMQREIDEINSLGGREFKIAVQGIGFDELTKRIEDLKKELADLNNPVTDIQRQDIEKTIATYESWRAQTVDAFDAFRSGWDGVKGIGGAIEGITNALEGNGNAWQKAVAFVDGFLQLYDGIQAIVSVIDLLTIASTAHSVAKGTEAGAETTEAATRAAAAATTATTSAVTITANKLEAASWKELAASEYMAAHAYIPFAGFAIGAGFTTAMLAMTAAAGIPMLADGGIASGPTLAMVGEYAGAGGNPEVIAPLDKLRSMLSEPESGGLDKVVFEIKGRTLVGILDKEYNIVKRS